MLKLYIAVLEEVPDHMVPVLVAHSVLNAHFDFYEYQPLYRDWLKESFKKVVVRVNRTEFAKIADLPWVHLGHENSTLNGEKSCAVVCPRLDKPRVLQFAKLWKPDYKIRLVMYEFE